MYDNKKLIGCIDKKDQGKRYEVYEELITTLIEKVIPETPNLSEKDIELTEKETTTRIKKTRWYWR